MSGKRMIVWGVVAWLAAAGWGCDDSIECERCRDWKVHKLTDQVGTKKTGETTVCVSHAAEESKDVKIGLQVSGIDGGNPEVNVVVWAEDCLKCEQTELGKCQKAQFEFAVPRQKRTQTVTLTMLLDPEKNTMRAIGNETDTIRMMLENDLVKVSYVLENGTARSATFPMFGLRQALATTCDNLKACPAAIAENMKG
jgi:hypothetical protein